MSDARGRSLVGAAPSGVDDAPLRPTVLVVDDEPVNRTLIRAMLGPAFSVVDAGSGAEALRILAEAQVDLVLLDVRMPEMDGYEVCRRIRSAPQSELLPVVLVSASMTSDDRAVGFAAGADDFQRKPVDRGELLLRVASLLRAAAQERRLRTQLRSLQEVSALKDDLVSLAVHDLRNPLSGVLALLQRMRAVPAARTEAEIDRLLQTTTRMHHALDDMLRIRELEEGRVQLVRTEVDVQELAQDAVEEVRPSAAARGLSIEVTGAPVPARLDRTLVARAVQNLVGNAIKFSPRDMPIVVHVSGEAGDVCLSVCDRGPGISPVWREAVFDKFMVGNRRADAGRAFGLGLYLVRLVAEAHGGRVEARDHEGGGACILIHLPRADA